MRCEPALHAINSWELEPLYFIMMGGGTDIPKMIPKPILDLVLTALPASRMKMKDLPPWFECA
jgi:hypothetical protein